MFKLIKILIISAVISITAGCCTTDTNANNKFSASFSGETYVWEQYQQSTNQVNHIR